MTTSLVKHKFIKILNVELEDLESHIDLLEDDSRGMRERRQSTEHVTRENMAVFENEKRCLRHFATTVAQTDPEEYGTLDELIAHLKERLLAEVHECGYVHAAYVFAERKMEKVARYVTG